MDIKKWFETSGSYEDGLKLYSQLKSCNANRLRQLQVENKANFLALKYELKIALEQGQSFSIIHKTPSANAPVNKIPVATKIDTKVIIEQSAKVVFKKETMADYPPELHSTYRDRINTFYHACELKFKLNAFSENQEDEALKIIIQLDDLWTKIDRYWMILNHWKDHNRMMPVKVSEDFTGYSPTKLFKLKNNLEARISKRSKTIESLVMNQDPESQNEFNFSNKLNRKAEELEQLKIDLETVRNLIQNE